MNSNRLRKAFVVAMFVTAFLLGGYEVAALMSGVQGSTISEHVWAINARRPLLAFAFGFLMGHFFWQKGGDGR